MEKMLCLLLMVPALAIGQTVYKTPSGKKYHTADCHMIKNKSQALNQDEAAALHLSPCKICHPGPAQRLSGANAGATVSGERSKAVQCKGQTKKGTRCKHFTKIGNGYCFQHQPQQ